MRIELKHRGLNEVLTTAVYGTPIKTERNSVYSLEISENNANRLNKMFRDNTGHRFNASVFAFFSYGEFFVEYESPDEGKTGYVVIH